MRALFAAAAWAVLAWWLMGRGGFAAAFLFSVYSLILAYGIAVRRIGLIGVRAEREMRGPDGTVPLDGTYETGEEAMVRVTLHRRIPFPVPWLIVKERVGAAEHAMFCGAWFTRRLAYEYALPLPHRGVFVFEAPEVWSGDPFGVLQFRVRARGVRAEGARAAADRADGAGGGCAADVGPAAEVAVAPRPSALGDEALRALLALGAGRGAAPRRMASDPDGERLETRAYEEGDSPARVLWKLAARTGEMRVRIWEPPHDGLETAVLLQAGPGDDDAALDRCAAAAAGALKVLAGSGRKPRLLGCGGAGPVCGPMSDRRALAEWGAAADRGASASNGAESLRLPERTGSAVIVCDVLRPETADLCRGVLAGGRDALVLACGGRDSAPQELAGRLRRMGARLVVLPGSPADGGTGLEHKAGRGGNARLQRGNPPLAKGGPRGGTARKLV